MLGDPGGAALDGLAGAQRLTPKVSTAVARNTSTASMTVELSLNMPARISATSMAQILKFTRRYMMKLPMPIQVPATASAVLVMSSFQTPA